jgi:SAM-dependent methyltransferase
MARPQQGQGGVVRGAGAPASPLPYLNLGCGLRFHPDWTNLDLRPQAPGVIAFDLREKLAFASGSFEAVYHAHLLEHLPPSLAGGFLSECFRVLKPGGILRAVAPDLEAISRLYLDRLDLALGGDRLAGLDRDWLCLEMFDQMTRERGGGEMKTYLGGQDIPNLDFIVSRIGEEAHNIVAWARSEAREAGEGARPERKRSFGPRSAWRWAKERLLDRLAREKFGGGWREALAIGLFRLGGEVHRTMYDRYSLACLLEASGFRQARVLGAGESGIPGFASFHLEVTPDGRVRKPDSLYMESLKPASPAEES